MCWYIQRQRVNRQTVGGDGDSVQLDISTDEVPANHGVSLVRDDNHGRDGELLADG
jgi:hypothetical protein